MLAYDFNDLNFFKKISIPLWGTTFDKEKPMIIEAAKRLKISVIIENDGANLVIKKSASAYKSKHDFLRSRLDMIQSPEDTIFIHAFDVADFVLPGTNEDLKHVMQAVRTQLNQIGAMVKTKTDTNTMGITICAKEFRNGFCYTSVKKDRLKKTRLRDIEFANPAFAPRQMSVGEQEEITAIVNDMQAMAARLAHIMNPGGRDVLHVSDMDRIASRVSAILSENRLGVTARIVKSKLRPVPGPVVDQVLSSMVDDGMVKRVDGERTALYYQR